MINTIRPLLCWVLLSIASLCSSASTLLDPVFNTGSGADSYVEQVLPLPDGKILISGFFNHYNGEDAVWIARLNEDGSLDHSFKHAVNFWVRHMILQPDGKIVIGGAFSQVDGQPRSLIARLNYDGSLDPTFNPGLGFEQKLVDGDPNPPYVFWTALQPDGKILCTGSFAKFNGQTAHAMARLNPDGSLDSSFQMGAGFDSWGRSVQVLPNNKILFTGWMTSYNGFSCNRMVMMNPDGSPDSSFRPYFGDKTSIYCAVLLANGQMIASGHTKNEQGLFSRKILRLNPDGSEDTSFLGHTDERTECIIVQPTGKILISGWFTSVDDEYRGRIARLNPDGSLDPTFVVNADQFIWTIAPDSKGRILVSGGFSNIGGIPRVGVARLLDPDLPPLPEFRLSGFRLKDGAFEMPVVSDLAHKYTLESSADLSPNSWRSLQSSTGTGSEIVLRDASPSPTACFYRLRVE
jgi:uncharacterized delta-60 repeat protein